MIMLPAAHLSSSKYVNGRFSESGYDCFINLRRGFSDLMADDESRTETSVNYEEDGSSSKNNNINIHDEMKTEEDEDHGRWLQLSLGGGHMDSTTTTTTTTTTSTTAAATTTGHRNTGEISPATPSVTLDLLPGGGSGSSSRRIRQPSPPPVPPPQPPFHGHLPPSTAFFLPPQQAAPAMNTVQFMTLQQQQQQQQVQQESSYDYLHFVRPFTAPHNININPPVSSSSSFSGSSEQHGRPIHLHRRLHVARVINPPRRPNSGVWFMLQASQNQAKEPFLPQIPKSYLRIKDGRMTVGLLIKYLVNKLELQSESQVEITCKGHQLLSLLTLQHVRDTIWNSPRNDVGFSVIPQSSATTNHLMVLNYGRIA